MFSSSLPFAWCSCLFIQFQRNLFFSSSSSFSSFFLCVSLFQFDLDAAFFSLFLLLFSYWLWSKVIASDNYGIRPIIFNEWNSPSAFAPFGENSITVRLYSISCFDDWGIFTEHNHRIAAQPLLFPHEMNEPHAHDRNASHALLSNAPTHMWHYFRKRKWRFHSFSLDFRSFSFVLARNRPIITSDGLNLI